VSSAPATPAASTPNPPGDAGNPWLSADRIFMEVLGIGIGVGAATLIALDGESNWRRE